MTSKAHHKHSKIARPSLGNYCRNEWAILGSTCSVIQTLSDKVIQALEDGLGLADKALALSWESLAEAGNTSSASVLLILDKTMKRVQPKPGEWGLLMAMGPAFCAELVLLQW